MTLAPAEQELLAKIRGLPPDKVAEVEDFVDFLSRRVFDRQLTGAASQLSQATLAEVWDNPDDAEYDKL